MPAIAGLRGTGDFAANERPEDFREMILWLRPKGDAVIYSLLSQATGGGSAGNLGKEKTTDMRFHWWSEPSNIVRLQVNGALDDDDTTVVVDSADPAAGTLGVHYGTALNLVPGDILMVEPAADAAVFNPELLMVTAVASATSFTVARGAAGGGAAAAIANDAYLLKVGSAFGEGVNSEGSSTRNPVEYTNYCQEFRTRYEITDVAAVTKYRTGDPITNERKRKLFDHARDIEFALLWGRAHQDTDPTSGKLRRFMSGLRPQIPASNVTVFSADPTIDTTIAALSSPLKFTSDAGSERIVLCGLGALTYLNRLIAKESSSQFNFDEVLKVYGMNLRRLVIPQGEFYFKEHPLLTQHPIFTNSMFILDFSALRWRYLDGMDTKFSDNLQNKGDVVQWGRWRTIGGLEVWHGGLTCGYIGGFYDH